MQSASRCIHVSSVMNSLCLTGLLHDITTNRVIRGKLRGLVLNHKQWQRRQMHDEVSITSLSGTSVNKLRAFMLVGR